MAKAAAKADVVAVATAVATAVLEAWADPPAPMMMDHVQGQHTHVIR